MRLPGVVRDQAVSAGNERPLLGLMLADSRFSSQAGANAPSNISAYKSLPDNEAQLGLCGALGKGGLLVLLPTEGSSECAYCPILQCCRVDASFGLGSSRDIFLILPLLQADDAQACS